MFTGLSGERVGIVILSELRRLTCEISEEIKDTTMTVALYFGFGNF